MLTDYRTESTVLMSDLFDGRLSEYGISEHYTEKTSATTRCLTENDNYIWVYGNPAGCATCLTRYGMNFPVHILKSIAQEFDTEIYSEHQPQFWGFSSQGEWDKWHLEQAKIDQEEFTRRSSSTWLVTVSVQRRNNRANQAGNCQRTVESKFRSTSSREQGNAIDRNRQGSL